METKRKSAKVAVSLLALAGLAVFSLFAVGGSLEPSAPPGPTMKTLDEVEPRIPIHASDLPLTIATPGSYYLAENITTGGGGITIDANNVTIDLMGFALSGGIGDGISVSAGRKNIAIKNGTVSGWSSRGMDAGNAINSQFANLRASDNGTDGLSVGFGSTVTNCTASDNGGSGIFATGGSTVTNCTVRSNTGDGIQVSWSCRVVGNTCIGSGFPSILAGAGIHVTGRENRIEANNITGNDRGIDVDSAFNLIIKNSARRNTTNYDIVGSNTVGPILGVADPIASTNPWANFEF